VRLLSRSVPAAVAALAVCAGCSKRNLDAGGVGSIFGDAGAPGGDAGGLGGGAGGASTTGGGNAGGATGAGGAPVIDAGASACVTATVALPWTIAASAALRLETATTTGAVAVMNRQAKQADVRTFARDGSVIGGFQFSADAQFLPYDDSRFLLVARGTTGDFVATAIDPDLVHGTRLSTASANATEHMLAAVPLSPTAIAVITDEHFVNVTTGDIVAWSSLLDAADLDALANGRIYGLAARPDRVLLAWGDDSALRLAVVSATGALISHSADDSYLGYQGSDTASAIPYGTGMLLFDGNPVRATQIGFDLSRNSIGANTQLRTFYRTTPRVAAIALLGQPIGFWLTVFPSTDNSQGTTTHQLYGCALDLTAPDTCLSTAPIAATGLGGYGIAQQPVAAAAFPNDGAFAVAHSDGNGQTWLRVADFSCAQARDP
jgi:hypothetical protein